MSPIQIEQRANREVIDWAHDSLGLGYGVIGRATSAHERTVLRWKSGQTLASPRHRERIEQLRELRHLMGEVFADPDQGRAWLYTSVPALRGRTPISYLRAGRVRAVVEVLATFHSGAFV
jgi:uncharacterized protein (DUF2384 family)